MSRRHRRNPDALGSVAAEAKRAVSPSSFVANVKDGSQIALGFGAVSAIGAALNRVGAGQVLARVPEGVARTVAGYIVKGFSVGLVSVAARLAGIGGDFGARVRAGAKANFGVTVLRDVAGVIPGGGRIRAFLSGMGNYFQADGWPAMGDYLNAQMQPTLPPPSYAPTDGIYGTTSDMYGGAASVLA